MAGRERRLVKREANGQPQRSVSEARHEVMSVVRNQRRALGVSSEHLDSPFAGYELGRLFLKGAVTEEQRLAGEAWARLDARYRAIYGLKAPQVCSAPMERIGGLSLADEPTEPEKVIKSYRRAETDLSRVRGRLWAVESTCLYDEPPLNIALLISGLNVLIHIWGLTVGRKSA